MSAASLPTLTWVPGMDVGAFRLLREIARGGMGEIWLAHQRGVATFERLVVIKRVIANEEEDPGFVTLFLDEARIVAQLHHPNIVQVFDLGQLGTSYFLVMEFLAGQPLARVSRRVVQATDEFPTRLAVEIISAAARGLGYAHQRKDLQGRDLQIVHRDVSPQNVFITYDGQVKVLDFGIAKAAGRLARTSTGVLRGKVKYMAPEQAMGHAVDPTADVYALGIMLFELVTGTRLYGDVDEAAIVHRLATSPAPRASSRKADLDRRLDTLIARMLHQEPSRRFADGQAVHEALEQWLRAPRTEPKGPSLEQTMRLHFAAELAANVDLASLPERAGTTPVSNSLPNLANPEERRRRRRVLAWGLGGAALLAANGAAWYAVRQPPSAALVASPRPSTPRPTRPDEGGLTRPAPISSPRTDTPLAAGLDAGTTTPEPAKAPGVVAPTGPPGVTGKPDAGVERARMATGRLTLLTDPGARVSFGTRDLGHTPLMEVSLPVGRQRLRLVNPQIDLDTIIEVEIRADALTTKKLSF